ncbi:MAG: hypothetical protein HY040_12425 [Planctomycetes bacterium]|nr:hypothetical protein [Planctomycetota bacterium]
MFLLAICLLTAELLAGNQGPAGDYPLGLLFCSIAYPGVLLLLWLKWRIDGRNASPVHILRLVRPELPVPTLCPREPASESVDRPERQHAMDIAKCNALKKELAAQPEPHVVPIARFFDGNDDLGSIGCNLPDHPGIDTFREILTGLLNRPDVEAVYAQISELDPGEDSWPFADTVLVAGMISSNDLAEHLAALQPDEVSAAEKINVPSSVRQKHKTPIMYAWWD